MRGYECLRVSEAVREFLEECGFRLGTPSVDLYHPELDVYVIGMNISWFDKETAELNFYADRGGGVYSRLVARVPLEDKQGITEGEKEQVRTFLVKRMMETGGQNV